MKWPPPPPAGGGKPFPNFSHPPWPRLGSGWSWSSTPVPWPLTRSVTWVWRRKEKGCFSPPPPSSNTVWDYSGIVILGLILCGLLFSLCPAAGAGGMEMSACCWSEQRRMPSPLRGDRRGWIWGAREPEGCLNPCASQAWLWGHAHPLPCKNTPWGPVRLLGDLRFSPNPSLMLRSDLNTCSKLIACICAF